MAINDQRRVNERDAAAYLGPVAVRTLQDWRNRGVGPAYSKLGKRVAYGIGDLDAYLAAQRVEPKADRGSDVVQKVAEVGQQAMEISKPVRHGRKADSCQ